MVGRPRRKPVSLTPLLPRGKRARRKAEFLGGAALSLFVLLIVTVFFASGLQRIALRSPNVAAVVSAVLAGLADEDRTASGLPGLTVNPVLVAAAQAKANDMAEKGYFAHVSPDGVDPWHWFKQAGYAFSYAGENLAVDFSDSGDVNSAWMNSPAHRENLLNPKFTEVGIATAQGMYQGRPTTFVVQEFAAPAVAGAPQAKVTETVVPKAATQPALASAQAGGAKVLGAAAPPPRAGSSAIATTEPALAASLAQSTSHNISFWSFLVGFPRDSLRYAYYGIGALVLLALAVDTELEFRARHRARALRAGALLLTMGVLFMLASFLFFAQPTLAATAALL